MKIQMVTRWFTVSAILFSTANCVMAEPVKLTVEEMSGLFGGATINTFDFPQANTVQNTDNVLYSASFEHTFTSYSDIIMEVRAGGNKLAYKIVSTTFPAGDTTKKTGNLKMRAPWPLAAPAMTASLSYCNPTNNQCGLQPFGPNQNANVSMRTDLRVTKVIFHNLMASDGSEATSVSEDLARSYVDNLDSTYDPTSTPATDPLLSQCADGTRWNMRFQQLVVDTVPKANLRIGIAAIGAFTASLANAIDPSKQYLHVFFFKQMINADNSLAGGLAASFSNTVSIIDGQGARWTAKAITHEFGHTQLLAHIDDARFDAYGPGQAESWSSLSNCNDPNATNKNLMCSTYTPDSSGQLLQVQCNHMLTNPTPVTDFN